MKPTDFSALSDEALVHKEMDLERTLLGHQFRHRIGKLENTSLLGRARRDIARAQTVLTTRERAAGENKGTLKAKFATTYVVTAVSAGAAEAGGGFLKGLLDKPEAAE